MKKQIAGIVTTLAVTGWALTAAEEPPAEDQVELPQITAQPTGQDIPLGGSTLLTVESANADSYQWLRNGKVMDGETHSTLKLDQVSIRDVGHYTCCVVKGYELVPTRTATLNAYSTGGGTITVFGMPVVSNGSASGCPGFTYAGYINFTKTMSQGWGWVPTAGTTVHTATDTNRTDTRVYYLGRSGDDGCAQTTVAVPDPTVSSKYRFTILFPNNVPTSTYAITLSGFNS